MTHWIVEVMNVEIDPESQQPAVRVRYWEWKEGCRKQLLNPTTKILREDGTRTWDLIVQASLQMQIKSLVGKTGSKVIDKRDRKRIDDCIVLWQQDGVGGDLGLDSDDEERLDAVSQEAGKKKKRKVAQSLYHDGI
jgi:hypothetical protein